MGIQYDSSKGIGESLSNSFVVLESGFGVFRVSSVADKVSRNGNKMVEITYAVKDSKGQVAEIKEYIVEGNDMTVVNVAKFLASVNAHDDFNGDFNAIKYLNKTGRCEIYHEEFVSKKGNVLQSNRMEKMPRGDEWDEPRFKSKKLSESEIIAKRADAGITQSPDGYLKSLSDTQVAQANAAFGCDSFQDDDDIPF